MFHLSLQCNTTVRSDNLTCVYFIIKYMLEDSESLDLKPSWWESTNVLKCLLYNILPTPEVKLYMLCYA